MRQKVFATIELEFEIEDRGYDMSPKELRGLVEASVLHGLMGEAPEAGLAAVVNHVAVMNWNP